MNEEEKRSVASERAEEECRERGMDREEKEEE